MDSFKSLKSPQLPWVHHWWLDLPSAAQQLKLASPKTAASASASISSKRLKRPSAVQPGACVCYGKFTGFIGKCTGNCRNPILFPSNKRGCPANFSSSNSVKNQWKSQPFIGMFELALLTLLRSNPLTIPGVNHQARLFVCDVLLVWLSRSQTRDHMPWTPHTPGWKNPSPFLNILKPSKSGVDPAKPRSTPPPWLSHLARNRLLLGSRRPTPRQGSHPGFIPSSLYSG